MNDLFDGGFDALDFFSTEMKIITEQLQHIALSICEGREFIARPARCKCPYENMLLKLRTKAEI